MFQPRGVMPPHITPFTSRGELDEAALRRCVDFWIESGVSGLVPCGSNGEAPLMSREERRRVIEVTIDQANGRVPVIAGTGSQSGEEAIRLTKDAKDVGADAVLVVTPYYFRPSGTEIFQHYKSICESVDIPMMLYNVPKFTGFNLEPEAVKQLTELDGVVGIKDSSGSLGQIAETIRLVGDRISVMAGTGDLIYPTLAMGGAGSIAAVANAAPKYCSDIYRLFMEGRYSAARDIQLSVLRLNALLTKKYGVVACKAALQLLGLPAGTPKKPLLELNEEGKTEIRSALEELGLLGI